jgi:hypothetical protein
MAAVAAVRLVRSLAGQDHLDVVRGEARELEQRGCARDAAGLLEPRHAARELGEEVGLAHDGVVVVGAHDARRLGGERALVDRVAVAGEADREGRRRRARARLHGCHHARAVDAPGQEGAVGHVGHHLALDRVAEALGEPAREHVVVALVELLRRRLAPARDAGRAAVLEHERGGRRKLPHALEERARRRHEATGEVVV